MASNIQILNEPAAYTPVYNFVEFVFKEAGTPSGGPLSSLTNYQFVVTISITDYPDETFYVKPRPDFTLLGRLDISRTIEKHIQESLFPIRLGSRGCNGITSRRTQQGKRFNENALSNRKKE